MKQTTLWAQYNYFHPDTRNKLPKVGVSACLLGENVRYDGQHKNFPLLNEAIVPQVHVISLCPEVAVGMSVPRPPIKLTLRDSFIEARGVDDDTLNMTAALSHFADQTHQQHNELCGYIFKARSPSCGHNTTPLFDAENNEIGKTDGIFSARLKKQTPWLPVCDEEDLISLAKQENFLLLVYLVNDWRLTTKQTPELLADFFDHHKKESAHANNDVCDLILILQRASELEWSSRII